MSRCLGVVLLAAVVAGGCGGSHADDDAGKALTVPAYSSFPATTIPVTRGTPASCRAEADAFSRAAASFLRPFPSDADNFEVIARIQFTAFMAHLCDTAILRKAFSRRLTAKQRRVVIADFDFLGEIARELEPTPR